MHDMSAGGMQASWHGMCPICQHFWVFAGGRVTKAQAKAGIDSKVYNNIKIMYTYSAIW